MNPDVNDDSNVSITSEKQILKYRKMERRKCQHCNEPIPKDKRADSKFCSNSCKAWYWEKHKAGKATNKPTQEDTKPLLVQDIKLKKGTPLEGLRGVINDTPEEKVKQTAMPSSSYPQKPVSDGLSTDAHMENPEYTKLLDKKAELEAEIKREEGYLIRFDEDIKKAGAMQNPGKDFRDNKYWVPSSDIYQLKDLLFLEEGIEDDKKFESGKQKRIKGLIEGKAKCQQVLEHNRATLKQFIEALSKTPRYLKKLKSWSNLFSHKKECEPNKPQPQENINEIKQDYLKETNINQSAVDDTDEILKNNPWIINSEDLFKVKRSRLNFQGKWKDFLGLPGTDFHLAVHGASGQGKSTMCFQFAKYLGDNIGRVIYIANEEHTDSVTFEQKAKQAKAVGPNLKYINIPAYEHIQERVPAGIFHFIFIDSLNTLNISPERLRELKAYYANSAFITISRETKGGQLRGSNEILHDADIVAEVVKLIGTTTKNRFKECGMEYVILPPNNNNGGKSVPSPKNVVS